MKKYARKYNTWIGEVNGACPFEIQKQTAMDRIKTALDLAHQFKEALILYYTGQSERGTGDWAFTDNERISFDEVSMLIKESGVRTCIIADCPFSGSWAKATANLGSDLLTFISATDDETIAIDGALSSALWDGAGYATAIQPKPMIAPVRNQTTNALLAAQLTARELSPCWFVDADRRDQGCDKGLAEAGRGVTSARLLAGGMALCAAAWDATALLGNPLAVPGVTGSLACMAAVGAATAARGQLERLGGYLSGLLAGSWGRGDA